MADPHAVLRDVFGHAEFRGGQLEAIEAVLAGRDAVVLLPTGAGKSSCYQVPAVVLARRGAGTTLVVSPLIALMVDQVSALIRRRIAAAAITAAIRASDAQRERSIGSCAASSRCCTCRRSARRSPDFARSSRGRGSRSSRSTRRTASASGGTTFGPGSHAAVGFHRAELLGTCRR